VWLAAALEFLADTFDGLERFTFLGLPRVFGISAEMPAYHHSAVREFLGRGCSPNSIGFLKAHHLNEEITAPGRKAVVQRRLTLACSFVPRQDTGLV
jgi:hypothetical protein